MSDPNPWAALIPTVVTSAITTLVTMGIVGVVQMFKARGSLNKAPLELRRGAGNAWSLYNRTNRVMNGLAANVASRDNQYRTFDTQPGYLPAKQPLWLGEMSEGDTLQVTWVTLGRRNAKRWHNASVRIRDDADELLLKAGTTHQGGA